MGPKPRKSGLWTTEKEMILIDFMRQHTYMWDYTHKEYNMFENKRMMYKHIAAVLGPEFNGEMVRDRWCNMRTTYAANYKRVNFVKNTPKLDPSLSISPAPSWHLYNHLSFLEPSLVIRSTNNEHQVYMHDSTAVEQQHDYKMEDEAGAAPPTLNQDGGERPLCIIAATTGSATIEDPSAASTSSPRQSPIADQFSYSLPIKEEINIYEVALPPPPPSDDGYSNLSSAGSLPIPTTSTAEQSLVLPTRERRSDDIAVSMSPAPSGVTAASSDGDEWDDFGRMVSKILRNMPEKDAREVQIEFFRLIYSKSSKNMWSTP